MSRRTALAALALAAACSPPPSPPTGATRARRALLEGAAFRHRGQDALAEESWKLCLSLAGALSAEAQECRDDLSRLAAEKDALKTAAGPRDASTGPDGKK